VIEVRTGAATLRPLWTKGPDRVAPLSECRRLVRFIPQLLRERTEALFPSVDWKKPEEVEPVRPPDPPDEDMEREPTYLEVQEAASKRLMRRRRSRRRS